MTVEEMEAALEREGWRLWHMGRDLDGRYSCRLFNADIGRDVIGQPGVAGYDLPCWRAGTGPTMLAAMSAAAAGIVHVKPKVTLDLAAMLR